MLAAQARALPRPHPTRSRRPVLTLPNTDLPIAACARHHDLGLRHRDRPFELLAEAVPALIYAEG